MNLPTVNLNEAYWLQPYVSCYLIGIAVIWIILAFAVWIDAANLSDQGKRLRLVGPLMWFLVVLFFGLPGAMFYWSAHRSTLAGELEAKE